MVLAASRFLDRFLTVPRITLGSTTMATEKLTEKSLPKLALPTNGAAQAYYWDEDLKGFGLVVGKTGQKTFVVYAWVAGRTRRARSRSA